MGFQGIRDWNRPLQSSGARVFGGVQGGDENGRIGRIRFPRGAAEVPGRESGEE